MRSINALEARLSNLCERDQFFAKGLIASVRKFGSPTDKQRACLIELWNRSEPKPAAETRSVGSLARINEMFDAAKANLKNPFIKFAIEDNLGLAWHLKVSQAKAHSQNSGCLYVKSKQGEYMGKITAAGEYLPSREVAPDSVSRILAALQAFAANPAEQAKLYGQQFGECCFCARKLTDKRSIDAGYGPICAENYGLPWGWGVDTLAQMCDNSDVETEHPMTHAIIERHLYSAPTVIARVDDIDSVEVILREKGFTIRIMEEDADNPGYFDIFATNGPHAEHARIFAVEPR